jgi:hypothetical protein
VAAKEGVVTMNRFFLLPLLLVVLTVLSPLGLVLAPVLGLDVWDREGLFATPAQEDQRGHDLAREHAAWLDRAERRNRVIDAVIDGRLTLREAAAAIFAIRKETEQRFPAAPRVYRELPQEEGACREVIDRVRATLPAQPEKARTVVRRLEAELLAHRQTIPSRPPSP